MRFYLVFICLMLTALWATEGLAQGGPTLWEHNGSYVVLSSSGAQRQFRYQAPVAELRQYGVQPGTLLFDGRRDGNQYSGTAYVFSKVCGGLPYDVAGPVSSDQRNVTMHGKAPIVDASCRIVGYRDDVLVFNFSPVADNRANDHSAVNMTATQEALDREWNVFAEQWNHCFAAEQTIDVVIRVCDAALSYPRLDADDRVKLLAKRAALQQSIVVKTPPPVTTTVREPDTNSIRAPLILVGCAPCQGFSFHREWANSPNLRR